MSMSTGGNGATAAAAAAAAAAATATAYGHISKKLEGIEALIAALKVPCFVLLFCDLPGAPPSILNSVW